MLFTQKQRKTIPSCIDGRKNHAWYKGSLKYGESGICAYCGYDAFDMYHREVKTL